MGKELNSLVMQKTCKFEALHCALHKMFSATEPCNKTMAVYDWSCWSCLHTYKCYV